VQPENLKWASQHLAPYGVHLYRDLETMLHHPDQEALTIASPTHLHLELRSSWGVDVADTIEKALVDIGEGESKVVRKRKKKGEAILGLRWRFST